MNDNKAMTVSDLARRWSCSRRSVLDAIHAGKIAAFKIGSRVYRVAVAEVERYERGDAA
jgi:excisionase family DNA binding protein